jgi:hypothetical protein
MKKKSFSGNNDNIVIIEGNNTIWILLDVVDL